MEKRKTDFELNITNSKSENKQDITLNIDNIYDLMKSRQIEWCINNDVLEDKFMKFYQSFKELKYINKKFYSITGNLSEESLKQEIQAILTMSNISKGLSTKVNSLLASLKNSCLSDYTIEDNVIYTENEKLRITKEKGIEILNNETTTNRLNARYIENYNEPKKWLQFLNDLFDEVAISILQQFLGYCLLANISAQKMLIIIGETGIGKSRIGVVLKIIFGDSMLSRGINELFDDNNNRFSLANAANKLIYYDDDISTNYTLNESRKLKILVSGGDGKSDEKFEKELTFTPYGKVIALGNYNIKTRKSDTAAIKRRSIILKTKRKKQNRIDNTQLDKELLVEKDLIFNWMLDGAIEIVKNKYHFSNEEYREGILNEYFCENRSDNKDENNNSYIHEFLSDKNYIVIDGTSKTFTIEIYETYKEWCKHNNKECYNEHKFSKDLKKAGIYYNIVGKDIRKNGNKLKGYIGIKTKD